MTGEEWPHDVQLTNLQWGLKHPRRKRSAFWDDVYPQRDNMKYQFLYLPAHRVMQIDHEIKPLQTRGI